MCAPLGPSARSPSSPKDLSLDSQMSPESNRSTPTRKLSRIIIILAGRLDTCTLSFGRVRKDPSPRIPEDALSDETSTVAFRVSDPTSSHLPRQGRPSDRPQIMGGVSRRNSPCRRPPNFLTVTVLCLKSPSFSS